MEKKNNKYTPTRQSQPAPKPLYISQRGDTIIAVLPTFLRRGAIVVKIQTQGGDKQKKLQAKAAVKRFAELDFCAPVGTVIAEAVDVIPPETCADIGYRDDGKGYARALTVTILDGGQVQVMIVCTLCARDEEGHICSVGDYSHAEKIILPAKDMQDMADAITAAYRAAQAEANQLRPKRQYKSSRKADVDYDG